MNEFKEIQRRHARPPICVLRDVFGLCYIHLRQVQEFLSGTLQHNIPTGLSTEEVNCIYSLIKGFPEMKFPEEGSDSHHFLHQVTFSILVYEVYTFTS